MDTENINKTKLSETEEAPGDKALDDVMDEETVSEEDAFEDIIPDPEPAPAADLPHNALRNRKKKGRTVIIAVLAVLLVLIGGGIYLINHYLNQIQKIDNSTVETLSPSEFARQESQYWQSVNDPNYTEPESGETDGPTEADPAEDGVIKTVREPFQPGAYRATLSADDELVIFDHPVTPVVTWTGSLDDENLINIMLVGQDTRNTAYRERSDSMILVSINPDTHKVALISFLRDSYVYLGEGYGWNRLNNAYKIGGFPKMYEVFEDFFGLHIDGSICVNFGQFMSLVDLLGGVDVTLNETEARWLRYTLEQSVPDMRYWGQIVEARMPDIKAGTTVDEAIRILTEANFECGFTDLNGGVAPEDLTKAKVSSLWLDEAATNPAVTGKYYILNKMIFITYDETRISFPRIEENVSVASAAALLKERGFTIAYADKNGNTAPADSKAALVTKISTDAAGRNIPAVGDKFDKGALLYITYTENKANVPTIPAGTTVEEAETLLRSNGFKVAWTTGCGGVAPEDKTKALVTGIYKDRAGTRTAKPGEKLDINSTIYVAYEVIPESTEAPSIMPQINAGESVSSAVQKLTNAGFNVDYAEANGGNPPQDPGTATVVKVTGDSAGSQIAGTGTEWTRGTVMFITYQVPEPSTEESTEAPKIYMPEILAGETVSSAYRKLAEAGFGVSYGSTNNWTAPEDPDTATVEKVTDASGTIAATGSEWPQGTTLYIFYIVPEPSSEEPPAVMLTMPAVVGETVSNAVEALQTAGFSVAYAGGTAPEDPDTATVVSAADENGNPAEEGTEWPEGTTIVITYTLPEPPVTTEAEPPIVETTTASGGDIEPPAEPVNPVSVGDPTGGYTQTRSLYNPIVKTASVIRTSSGASASSDDPYYLANIKEGTVHLSGMQTLAYCRMRKLDSDFKRTERQRMVLNILFNKVKSSSIGTLNNLLNELLPQVATDLSNADIIKIAAIVLPYFSSINLELHSIPAAGNYMCVTIDGMAVVQLNQMGNIQALKSWLPY